VLLFVSRLDRRRRADLLLSAAARLVGAHPGLRVVIVGKGSIEGELRDLAASLGIAPRVQFVGELYDEMELAPYFLSASAFVFPEYMGLSVLHAFGYGLPVIASERAGCHGPEFAALRHGANGLTFRHGDADSLAEAIRTIIENPDLAKQMSAEALRTVNETYTLARMVDGFEAAARYCAGQTSAGR
jgi:glycosyltransferase involved in cell wall biosynthesis